MRNWLWIPIAMLACAWCSAPAAHAVVIIEDDFSGDDGDLHGTTPDVGAESWVAHSAFNADGSIGFVTGGSGAWLPFTPEDHKVYTLSASYRGVTGNANWLALGFAESVPADPEVVGNTHRFISDPSTGKAWSLFRGTNAANPNQTLRGDAASGTFPAGTVDWIGGPTEGGDVDLQIVLDTTGGPGAYVASFFAKRPAETSYTDVSGGALTLNAEDIGAVGMVYSNTGITGSVESFSLSVVPEPTTLMLVSIISVAVVGLRRKK